METGYASTCLCDMFNNTVTFQQDVNDILQKDNLIVTYSKDGNISQIYSFDKVSRFDTEVVYQQIKHVYSNHPDYLDKLFPSKDILISFIPEDPESSVILTTIASTHKHPKMILLELFNGFKSGTPTSLKNKHYYYYSFP